MQAGVAAIVSVTLQEPLAGMEPPVKVTCELPLTAVSVPPQLVVAPPETIMPLGNTSVKGAVNVAAVVFGFVRVMFRTDVPPERMVTGLNVLLTLGGVPAEVLTVRVETVPTVFVPVVACSVPAPMELRN